MRSSISTAGLVLATFVSACAAHSVPAARVGSAEATVRAARADGAATTPDAAVYLRLAEQQVDDAKRLIDEGEPERAEWLLVRAEADAALAAALSREAKAEQLADETSARARDAAEDRGTR